MRPNDAPDEAGHELLDATLGPAAVVDFPIVTAALGYSGYGPRAWCGWLQVLHIERTDEPTEHIVDAINVTGSDSPLYCFGYLPTFADAPASPGHADMDWRADTFLVTIPGSSALPPCSQCVVSAGVTTYATANRSGCVPPL